MSNQDLEADVKVIIKVPSGGSKDEQQTIVGKKSSIESGIEEFRGIPYGIVPGRWQHAILRTKLPSHTFDATSNGPRCCQPSESNNTDFWQSHLDFPTDVTESEFDCLNLLIARPSRQSLLEAGLKSQTELLPVYVFIHGGAYAFGAATDPMWDPTRLVYRSVQLKKPFIAVNINYRLNIFGFAASSDIIQAQSGPAKGCNFALGDQRVALEWVFHNISAFGGDPHRITVGGQSAGGTSAHVHVLDAKYSSDEPLIAKAIIQSAAVGALGPMSLAEAEERWNRLCQHFQVASLSATDRIAKLASVPAPDLLEAAKQAGWLVFPIVHDNLTVLSQQDGDWKFSLKLNNTKTPVSSTTDQIPALDILIGDTDMEGTVYRDLFVSKIQTFTQLRSAIMSSTASEAAIADIMQHYKFDTADSPAALQDLAYSFASDIRFGIAVDRAWHRMSTSSSQSSRSSMARQTRPIQYRVQFGNPFNGPDHNVAQHCVDLIYIYDCFHDDLRAADSRSSTQSRTNKASNNELVEQLQHDWIDFITGSHGDTLGGASEDDLIIYGRDRRRTVVPKGQDREYQERQARFEILEKHWVDINKVFGALRSI